MEEDTAYDKEQMAPFLDCAHKWASSIALHDYLLVLLGNTDKIHELICLAYAEGLYIGMEKERSAQKKK